ncbi:radical SAM protein [Clostridium tarantellae]|uniref:Radical SAM protein n=1 Tax=Clostridium tarantellae TaxID=39493 RepID=A0A6I1MJA7_9CLOT|nr:radical SAM protein [Clostridium tarantellae]MPQ42222.1 radical SAM protein [Clostridium tarantellae]
MDRYNIISDKNKREIVLLKSFPCIWGKCSFCDYIEDNCKNENEMIRLNNEILNNITGVYGVLEVINSGSVFELPKETLKEIKKIVVEKNIKKLFFESHWCYRNKLNEIRKYFGIPIIFKTGIETFDNNFRNEILNKNVRFKDVEEVKKYFNSVCIMVGIKGQTKEMIDKDIDILLHNFSHGTINIWTNNTTKFQRDEELINWFVKKYYYLKNNKNIEVLFENTDFGVGD